MYKTIRHGENSLQYTILPQNDDFRLEGKIKSAGSSKKPKNKKPKRRSFFAYVGLLFVCTVIVGAVLVPFLVSNRIPTEWFLRTKAAFTAENKETGPTTHTGNALANAMLNKGNLLALNKANVGKSVKIINKDGVEKIILKVNKTSTPTDANEVKNPVPIPTENVGVHLSISPDNPAVITSESNPGDGGETAETELEQKITIHDLNDFKNFVTNIPPQTINKENEATPRSLPATTLSESLVPTTTATLAPLLNRSTSSAALPNVPRASLQSSLNQNSNNSSSTQPTITTRIMQVPLLKSTAKKPAIPPVLVKNLSPIQPTPDNSNLNDIIPSNTYSAGGREVNKETTNSDWIHTHWPYIDPSTYFQWNGYKTEDSVLLPALLGFALIGVILIITVCLVARNKRTIVTSVRKRNRNDIEETGAEDNTTLLTNTNLSDED